MRSELKEEHSTLAAKSFITIDWTRGMEVTLTNYDTNTLHCLLFDDNIYDKESCFQVHSTNQNIPSGQRRSEKG